MWIEQGQDNMASFIENETGLYWFETLILLEKGLVLV
jgi:hypothetical protein